MSDNPDYKAYIDDISNYQPDKENANRHTLRGRTLVHKGMEKRGYARPAFAAKDGTVLGGNLSTLDVAVDIGLGEGKVLVVETDGKLPIIHKRVDVEPGTEAARLLALEDNRTAEISLDWDAGVLVDFMEQGLDITGLWDETELSVMLEGAAGGNPPQDPGPKIDQAQQLKEKWGTALGQCWALGEHRIVCGDCTDAAVVEMVMRGERAAIVFTSPPYNAGVSAQLSGNTSIDDSFYKNDDDNKSPEEYRQFLNLWTATTLPFCDYVFCNIQPLAGNKRALVSWWFDNIQRFADVIVWDKGHAAPQQAQRVLNSRFEFIIVFSQDATRAIGTRDFRGTVDNVFNGSPQRNNDYASSHAATMPLNLPLWLIENFTGIRDVVIDSFLGTGTTLIACENLKRKCRGIEIDPGYLAVTIQRWADLTARDPIRLSE